MTRSKLRRSIKMETKELIKELRILEKSSKLGEQACICGEAASRLEELQQEIEIAQKLKDSNPERNEKNKNKKQLLSEDKKKTHLLKNVMKPLRSFLKPGRKLYITGFNYDDVSYVLDIDEKYIQGSIGDYFVTDLMILDPNTYIAQINFSNWILKTWEKKYGCKEVQYTLKEKGLL